MKTSCRNNFILCVLLALAPTVYAQQNLADRHVAKQINCAACHGEKPPEPFAEVDNATCLRCHGPLEQLQSKYAALRDKNPHKNHLGDVSCTVCHKGHEQSVVYCDNCHAGFGLTIK